MNGNFTLEVKVHSYRNVLHQAVGTDKKGDCCDNEAEEDPVSGCTDPCDNFFVFCLREYNAPTDKLELIDCSQSNRAQTGMVEENNDNLTFTVGQPFPKSANHSVVSNPVLLNGSNWNVSV